MELADYYEPDTLTIDIVEYLENEEIGCQLSDDAILAIRQYVRAAYDAGKNRGAP